jgi:putative NADH-flavin reductase
MKVVVIGAHSGVGEHVIKELMERDHQSLAVVGNENQLEDLKLRGAVRSCHF